MLKKIADLLYDATFGLADECRRKTIQLAKISAAVYYLQVVRALRKKTMSVFVVIFSTLVLAITVVVTPFALLMLAPWNTALKMILIALLGLLYTGISLYYVMNLFSEKRWLHFSGSDEMVENVTGKKGL